MSKTGNKDTGMRGETAAAEFLQKKGYEILSRNYGSKWGEVDIICKYGDYRVFVEVKTKTGDKYGEPWEMINSHKISQIKQMGQSWCAEYGWKGLCRVDAVGVWMDEAGEITRIEHWENVIL